jgi:hypothetical protein
MHCTNCHADVGAWLLKYKAMPKIRLDEMYFKEEKVVAKWDESGSYLSGQAFYEHESKRAHERCPKCGTKNTVHADDDEIIWSPI